MWLLYDASSKREVSTQPKLTVLPHSLYSAGSGVTAVPGIGPEQSETQSQLTAQPRVGVFFFRYSDCPWGSVQGSVSDIAALSHTSLVSSLK